MSARNLDLYINLARPGGGLLLAGRVDLTVPEPPVFVDGEKPNLRLQFLQPSLTPGVAPAVTQLEVGAVILFALKKKAGGTLLVSGTAFVETGAGDELRYAALVNFDTAELIAALVDETTIAATGEVRLQNAENTERKTFQFRCSVRRRIYDGEGAPVAADPQYPAAESVLTTGADSPNLKRGALALEAGAYRGIAIAFVSAFQFAPTFVQAWVSKKAGQPSTSAFVNHDTITAAGFSADLGGEVPAAAVAGDYRLQWVAIP